MRILVRCIKKKKIQSVLVDCQHGIGGTLRVKPLTWGHGSNFGSPGIWVVTYLLIQLLLQILLRPGEFSEAASELILCCKKAFSPSDLLESSGEDELYGDETHKLMDVLVDTLLSLLPESSAPMRSAIEQVFFFNISVMMSRMMDCFGCCVSLRKT
ncbi:hypothetical protein VitviT2T_013653 [Vitis vinifera]|uniref:Uncharacterized protein n=1 Tax=Vitis vinifera TaxID=29760 RepID=A0ABY9CHB2_VITVI|nr:hypothetical protein VitviT2T_013653 [Vitis vinifera]